MTEDERDALYELYHEGVARRSGRYKWGSGDNPFQRSQNFSAYVNGLREKGLSEADIYKGLDMTSSEYRARLSIASNMERAAKVSQAQLMRERGMSPTAIGERMGINESSVRSLLNASAKERSDILTNVQSRLKDEVADGSYLDIGRGTENHMGVSKERLATAVALLKDEGYEVKYASVDQLGTGNKTSQKLLVPPGVDYKEVYAEIAANPDKIKTIGVNSDDMGRTFEEVKPITSIDSKRVEVRYSEDGGAEMDGVIEVRRGVEDLNMGNANYAQVRIGVDGTHYLKGMAVYSDDLPAGIDARFNTNKSQSVGKMDSMKKMATLEDGSIDIENPFSASIKPGGQKGVLNIVNEEGDWSQWSNKLSSQMMSKQSPGLAKDQLDITFKLKEQEFDEIMALTNPAVKKKLLESFADGADSSAVHLKAAGLPRTATHVILPVPSMKDNEIYAPKYKDGEKVVLVRHPHGGIFEIPELTVNNKIRDAKSLLGAAADAVAINSKVAERLSGADFDGDTVLVIPNQQSGPRRVKNSQPLEQLRNFDAKAQYPRYEGMKLVGEKGGGNTQQLMGDISNLITDMSVMGAPTDEIARAVKHSMVVIDAEKHKLNYKQSAKDNNIIELKRKYQGGGQNGAATLISRASSEQRVNARRAARVSEGGAIDKATGKKNWVDTGESYTDASGATVMRKVKSRKMSETDNALSLMSSPSGTPMEKVYGDHANRMKALGNKARKEFVNTPPTPVNKAAKEVYRPELDSLRAKLNIAQMNAPLERKAQVLGQAAVKARRLSNPNLDKDELKKIEGQELRKARLRVGADKQQVKLSSREWEAIQSGAVSNNMLSRILDHSDLDRVKELATPRVTSSVSPAKLSRAKAMIARGYTQAEVAQAIGVPVSTMNDAIVKG